MSELLPHRFHLKNPEQVHFCHLCHARLALGDRFVLLATTRKGIATEHYPALPTDQRYAPRSTSCCFRRRHSVTRDTAPFFREPRGLPIFTPCARTRASPAFVRSLILMRSC